MTKLYKATLDTRHFSFEALGATAEAAQAALRAGLHQHAKGHPGAKVIDMAADIVITEIEVGVCYRDGSSLP